MARLRAKIARPPVPHALGYRMPAEWEPHLATWLAWPHEKTDWPGKFEPIPWVYADIVRNLSRVERVRILVRDAAMKRSAREILKKSDVNLAAVDFYLAPTDRGWIRDFGPIFVRDADGDTGITNWRFNGWAKYDNSKRDDAATSKLLPRLKILSWAPVHRDRRVVLEGGAERWIGEKATVSHSRTGEVARMTGAIVDISDLKRAEAALDSAEARLERARHAKSVLHSHLRRPAVFRR